MDFKTDDNEDGWPLMQGEIENPCVIACVKTLLDRGRWSFYVKGAGLYVAISLSCVICLLWFCCGQGHIAW